MKYKDVTDKEEIRRVMGYNSSMPISFVRTLYHIGDAKRIENDELPGAWSTDKYFIKGRMYPVYKNEGVEFAIGEDGKGHKMSATTCWIVSYFYESN